MEKKLLPFKGAISVLHVKVIDSPSLTVADCGNVAKAGLFGFSFGAKKIDDILKNRNTFINFFLIKYEYFSINHFM